MRTFTFTLAILMAAGAAHAEDRKPANTEIAYSKQMLTTESGAQIILDEIVTQIREACEYDKTGTLYSSVVDERCVDEFLASAVKNIDSPNLTKAYLVKTGGN